MRTKLAVDTIQLSDHNEELGLYQFVVSFKDHSKARVFMRKDPDWKLSAVNRLLNVPCTICRKDYYCKCFEKYSDEIERQLVDEGYIEAHLAAKK
ncbi:hypothetical protein MO973_20900 [Paenibacillus sp. TRM 82003]|nr:hypothetical protein [Paenibacillus sp. TRM 82003]